MSSSSRRKQAGIFTGGLAIGSLVSTAVANADAVRHLVKQVAADNGLAERELPNDGNTHPLPQIGDDARVSSLTPGMSSGGHSSSVNPMDSAVLSGGLNPTKTMIGGDADAKLPPPPAPDQPAQPPKPVSHVLVSSNSQASLTEITQLADELDKTKTALATSGGGAGGGGSTEAGGTTAGGTTTTAPASETTVVTPVEPTTVTVSPLHASNDAYAVANGQILAVDAAHGVLANDELGTNGGALRTVAGTYTTANSGSVVLAADGSFTFSAAPGFDGADCLTYTVTDGQGGTTTATVQIAVGAAAPAPVTTTPLVAGDDAYAVGHDAPLNVDAAHGVLANDHLGSAGGNLAVTAGTYATAQGGQVVIAADGSYSYTPANGYSGADTFTYTVSDGQGGTATATVQIAVGAAAPAPVTTTPLVAGDDAYAVGHDAPLNVDAAHGVLANDHLGSAGGNLAVTAGTYATAQGGQVVIAADGSFTYSPANGFTGADSVTVTVSDGQGGTATSTVSFAVQAAPVQVPVATNHAPVVDADHTNSTVVLGRQAGSTAQGQIDFDDGDGDTMTLSLVGGDPAGAHVDLMPDGRYMVTRTAYETGQVQFTVRADDGHGGVTDTVVTVDLPPNQAPYAANNYLAVAHNASGIGDIGILDPEGAGVTAAKASDPANGTVTVNADGTYTYVPNAGFGGQDTFDVTITDVEGLATTVTVQVDVAPNQAPVAASTSQWGAHTAHITGNVGAFDPDGTPVTVTLKDGPAHGSVVVNADGSYTYTPAPGDMSWYTASDYQQWDVGQPWYVKMIGQDSFTVTISDGETSVDQVISITQDNAAVRNPAGAPFDPFDPAVGGTPNTVTVHYHDTVTLDLSQFFANADGDQLYYGDWNSLQYGAPTPSDLSLNGSILTVTWDGTGTTQFSAVASDVNTAEGFAHNGSNGSQVTVHLVHDNAGPTSLYAAPIHFHGATFTLDLSTLFTDADGDGLSYSVVPWTSSGSETLSGSMLTVPGGGNVGIFVDDGHGGKVAEVIHFELDNALPEAPQALTYADTAGGKTIDLLANVTDADGDSLHVTGIMFDGSGTWLTASDTMPSGISFDGRYLTIDDAVPPSNIHVGVADDFGGSATYDIHTDHNIAPTQDLGSPWAGPLAIAADTPTIMTTEQLMQALGVADGNEFAGYLGLSFDHTSGMTITPWGGAANSWEITGSAGTGTTDVHITDNYGAHLDVVGAELAHFA